MKNVIKYIIIINLIVLPYFSAQTDTSEDKSNNKSVTFLDEFNSLRNFSGIGAELNYKGEVFSNISGGMETKSVYLDNIDLVFDFNLEEIVGWKGAKLNSHILGNHGGDPSEYSGAAQGISNIAAYETWKLYQFWLEQNLFDEKLSLLLGLYDLNSEFDTRETSSFFINPSHGIGAEYALTGHNGPSIFPYTSLALRVKYNLTPSFNIKAAVFDGVPGDLTKPNGTHVVLNKEDGLILTTEISYQSETEKFNTDYFKYSFGGWYYTSEFEEFDSDLDRNPLLQKGNYGIYASAEKFLFGEPDNSSQGLALFLRIGFADKNVNRIDAYYGTGLTYTGLVPGRDEDVLGLAIATTHNNQRYINLMAKEDFKIEDYEYIIELTYILNVAGWLKVQPDLQYIFNPTYCNCHKYSFMYGTRLELAL